MQVQKISLFDQRCEDQGLSCAVCFEPYKNPQIITKCLHVFCQACVEPVKNCPVCREEFKPKHLKHDFDKDNRIEKIRNECRLVEEKEGVIPEKTQEQIDQEVSKVATQKTIPLLKDVYRAAGFICAECDEPYTKPRIYPSSGMIACAPCWKPYEISETKLWGESTITNRMEQLALDWKVETGIISENDQDWQNELLLRAVKSGNWDEARDRLEKMSFGKWNNMSQHILVEACEHSDVPRDIIEALLDHGAHYWASRPCINPFSYTAMTLIAVAAEKGAISALEVFKERNLFGVSELGWAASCAVDANQGKAFDIIWSQTRSWDSGHGISTERLCDRANTYLIHQQARNNGLNNIIDVLKKYFPSRDYA